MNDYQPARSGCPIDFVFVVMRETSSHAKRIARNEYLCVECFRQTSVARSPIRLCTKGFQTHTHSENSTNEIFWRTSFVHLSNINSNYDHYFLHSSNTRTS